MMHHTVRKRRQPDFLSPWLNSVIPLNNLSTTSLRQLYFLIFAGSAISWKAHTHKIVLEVGHKNEQIANSSQYHNHNVSLLFSFSNNQFLASMNDGVFDHFHGWKIYRILHMYQRSCSLHNQYALHLLGSPVSCGQHGHWPLFCPCKVIRYDQFGSCGIKSFDELER